MTRPQKAFASALALALAGALTFADVASAQDEEPAPEFSVAKGSQDLQFGFSMVSLPEIVKGAWSAQPEIRYGVFLSDGLQLQITAETRVWPLGKEAPKSYGGGVNLLWFPDLGTASRNFYLLVGGGGAYEDPPQQTLDASFDPMVRGGVGARVPLRDLGIPFMASWYLSTEFAVKAVLLGEDEEDYPASPGAATDLDYLSALTVGFTILL